MNAAEKAELAKKMGDAEKSADLCHEATNYFNSYKSECEYGYRQQVANFIPIEKAIQYWYAKGVISRDGKRDLKRAIKLYTQSAKGGHAEAMKWLGYIYEAVMMKSKTAFKWYKAGAESGNVDCMKDLAICYRDGYGVRASNSKSRYWAERFEQEKK